VPPDDAARGEILSQPKLVCEIEFTEWTPDGRLRHPSFQGLREDKPADRESVATSGRWMRLKRQSREAADAQ
jgi:ATP-dependent DNA ligase